MDRIEDKKIRITDEDFPAFLYESGTVYDEENEDVGLFRGYVLLRVGFCYRVCSIMTHSFQVYRSIFTGPSSAMDPSGKGANKTKARIFKLTEVTGRTIAYASVQVCPYNI